MLASADTLPARVTSTSLLATPSGAMDLGIGSALGGSVVAAGSRGRQSKRRRGGEEGAHDQMLAPVLRVTTKLSLANAQQVRLLRSALTMVAIISGDSPPGQVTNAAV